MTYHHDLCVLFLYHKCDDLTRVHLQSLREFNPTALILPLTDSAPELLPGSVDVGRLPSFCAEEDKWRAIDATLYRGFKYRDINARRYLVFEYDCLCTVSISDYYAEVWDADVAGVDFFKRQDNPRWRWFMDDELNKIPFEDRSYAAGIAPFTCTMFSHTALEKIVANVYTHDVFCELRLGTTVNKLGLKFQRLPLSKRSTICWHGYSWQTNRPGVFHAIKSLDHNKGKRRQPGKISVIGHDLLQSQIPSRDLMPYYWRGKFQMKKRLRAFLSKLVP